MISKPCEMCPLIYRLAFLLLLQLTFSSVNLSDAYTIPQPRVYALLPRGFRISIPDQQGITFFAFHGNVNREFRGTEQGEFHGEARRALNNEWVYQNDRVHLQSGDVVYYWLYVQHDRLRYRLDNARLVYPDDFRSAGRQPRPPNRPRPTTDDDDEYKRPINFDNIDDNNNQGDENQTNGYYVVDTTRTTSTTSRPTTGRTNPTRPPTARPTSGTTPKPPTRPTTSPPKPKPTTAAPLCTATITTIRNEPVRCSGQLIFEEQFETEFGESERWKPDIRMPLDSEDAEFVLYHNYSDVWNVSNGKLHIFPKLLTDITEFSEERLRGGELDLGAACTVLQDYNQECRRKAEYARILPPVVSARFTTRKSFSFKYGKMEIRAKLPKGDWLYPQLILEPVDNSYYGITGHANGQIRIAFIRSNDMLDSRGHIQIDGHRLSGGVVLISGETLRENWLKSTLQETHFAEDFHTYTLTWTDQRISLGFDGTNYAILNGNFKNTNTSLNIPHQAQWLRGNTIAPFDREFYISLGVGAGGISDFPDRSKTGESKSAKPWENTSPKAELRFWSSKDSWYPTWNSQESGLIVDYVKVWSI